MNSPKALDSTASDLRWAVDELIDFMESCLGRNPRDLKLHGLRISDSLANAAEWLGRDSSRSDKVSLESIAASVAVPAMNEIVTHANRRLRRNRELVPLENLRAQDARCLMWLARRPGNNLNEKLTKDRRLLGVVRELSFDVLENRVAYETARLLSRLLPSDPTTWKDADFRKARFACSEFLGMAESFGIRGLSHAPRPNNALLRDKKYRRIWLAYRWLLARDEFRETIGEQVRRSLAEALMLVMGALPETLDFQLADAALPCMARPSTLASWLRNSQMQWFRFRPGSLDLLEVSLIGNTHSPEIVVRWKSFKGRQHNLEDATAREMLLTPVFQDSRIEVSICDHGQAHHLTFCEENGGLRHMARVLHHHVAAWFEAYPAGDNVVNTSGPTGRKTLRFTATQLECGGINVDCFCGILRSQSDTEDVVLSGGGARNRRILGMGGVGGPGWITPGRLSRALSRPGVTGSAFRELVERAGHNPNDHPFEAIAVPAGLPFGFESAVRAGLGADGGDCWLIPQPISSVLAATWGHDSKIHPEPEDFYSSIDFDGERVDASLVRWTNIQDPLGNKSLGWLHFREIRDARQLGPRAIELIYQVLLLAMADAGVPNGRRRQACIEALHQMKISQLWGLLEDHPSCVEVWSLLNADEPVFCEVRSEHVQRCVTGWLETSVIPWLSEREAISSSRGGYAKKFLFNGAIFRIPWIRERFANWCEDMGTSKPTFLHEDQVAQGLVIFLKRQAAGEATWSEHLPVLEILGRNSQSQPQWLRMFDEDASVSPGGRILMGPSFSFVTDQRVFSVPMRCDGERGGRDPSVRIPDGCSLPVTLELQAQYDVGRAGLMMKVRSKELGLMPEITMEWGAAVPTPAEPQELCVYDDPIEQPLIEQANQSLKRAMAAFFEQNGGQNELRSAIDGVARNLGNQLRSSEPSAWRNVTPASLVELAGRLTWMHELGVQDYDSSVLLGGKKWRCELTSGVARSRRLICLDSSRLQTSLTSALGKMRSAAPWVFVEWAVKNSFQNPSQMLRHECIRALGRTFGPVDSRIAREVLSTYDKAFFGTKHEAKSELEDRSVWYWSFHSALSHSENSVQRFGLNRLRVILDALFVELEVLAGNAESGDPAYLRNLLAAILAARHGTRLEGGMLVLGPDADYAKQLVRHLEAADLAISSKWDSRKLDNVTILGFLEESSATTAFRSTSPIGQVSEIWAGRVKTLLRQVIDTD